MAEKIEIRVNISSKELEQKCRTCLKNDGVLNLFLTRHKDVMLYHLFPMLSLPEMDPSDNQLPQKICGICAKTIFEFYAFKERTAQTQVIIELAAGKLCYLNIEKPDESKQGTGDDIIIHASPEVFKVKQEINDNIIVEEYNTDHDSKNFNKDIVSDIQKSSNFETQKVRSQETVVKNRDSKIIGRTIKRTVAKCRFCKRKFKKYSDYLNHRIQEREKRIKVECPICNENIMSYRMENHLIVHRIKGHSTVKEHVYLNETKIELSEEKSNDMAQINLIENQQIKKDLTYDHSYLDPEMAVDHDYIENYEFVDNMQIDEINKYTCVLCNLKFETRTEYINHRRKEKEKRQRKACLVCNKKIPLFRMEQHSLLHKENKCKNAYLLIDDRNGELTCSTCNEMFNDKNDFKLHVQNSHGKKLHSQHKINKHACSVCKKHFSLARLKDHMSVHNTDMKQYMCEVCGKQFSYQTSLRFHKHSEVIEEYLCDLCGKAFSSEYYLRRHKQRVHEDVKKFACEFCGKLFININILKIHMRHHVGIRPFGCQICGKKFTQKTHLQTHIKGQHDPKVKNFQCSTCSRRFFSAELLAEHEERHCDVDKMQTNKKKKDKCDVCNHLVVDLVGHKQLHEAGYTYVCGFCNEGFTERYDLTTHKITIHFAKRRTFTCDICGKTVTTSQMLQSHRRIHTGEKPFQCKLCEKSFTQGSHLHTHMKWHTGEKEFECEFCKKRFSLKGNLKQHLRSHTGDKPFCCDICSKRFPTASSLRKHIAIHYKQNVKHLEENSMSS